MRVAVRLFAAPALLSLVWAAPAQSYKISVKGRFHERMTVLAERCLKNGPLMPEKCAVPTSREEFTSVPYREGKYWADSRWSDDPTRQSTSLGVFKFLYNVGADRCANYTIEANAFPGILCSGHYGTMQFLHSMASLAPGETMGSAKPEALDETKRKMLGWTEFAFNVATGALPSTSSYCSSARKVEGAGTALAPDSFPYCGSWTVGSLFGLTCSHPLQSNTCNPNIPEAGIRRAAMGALLHMVQDSYSRSHAGRGEQVPLGPYTAEVRCAPIRAFYRYTLEQKDAHGAADKAPEFSAECATPQTMDPITASARLIWLVENKCDASWAKEVIGEGVIGNRAPPTLTVEACKRPRS